MGFNNNHFEKLDRDLRFVTLGVGAYTGYCHATGKEPHEQLVEYSLLIGPTVANGIVGAIKGAGRGLIAGSAGGSIIGVIREGYRTTTNQNRDDEGEGLERTVRGTGSGILVGASTGVIAGCAVGGSLGIIHGGAMSLIGYWVGYSLGHIINFQM